MFRVYLLREVVLQDLKLTLIRRLQTHIVLTPINTVDVLGKQKARERTKKAREDYYREKSESNLFMRVSSWDDSARNNGKVGDLFGFVDYKADRIEVFSIIDFKQATLRREQWDIPEHQQRKVEQLLEK